MCQTCGCGYDHDHQQVLLPIKGLQCRAGASQLEGVLNQIPGIHATADAGLGVVAVLLHEDGDIAAVRAKILEMGYEL